MVLECDVIGIVQQVQWELSSGVEIVGCFGIWFDVMGVIQSQFAGTGPTSLGTDLMIPGIRQDSHQSTDCEPSFQRAGIAQSVVCLAGRPA